MRKRIRKLSAWFSLIRVGNAIALGYAATIGYFLGLPSNIDLPTITMLFVAAFLIGSGSNAINDYYDKHIDSINKPWRPIPLGLISPTTAYLASIVFFTAGILISFFVSFLNGITALIASTLSYFYSKNLKKIYLVGNIIVAFLTSLSIIYGGLASSITIHVCMASLYAFLLNIGREFLKGIEDVEGDRKYGIKTLAIVLGVRKTIMISTIVFIILIALSIVPFFAPSLAYSIIYLIITIIGVDIVILIALLKASSLNPKDVLKSTKLLKISVFCGISAFFIEALKIIYEL